MLTLEQIQNNIEAYCISHKLLLHSDSNIAFIPLYSNQELQSIRNKGSKNIVVVTTFQGRLFGNYDDKKLQQYLGLRFASFRDKDEKVNGPLNRSFEIMMDFITRWQHEYEENDCSWLRYVDLENISYDEIEDQPWLQNHYGWDLSLPLKNYLPPYNPDAWQ
jgi:hypothetical protein